MGWRHGDRSGRPIWYEAWEPETLALAGSAGGAVGIGRTLALA